MANSDYPELNRRLGAIRKKLNLKQVEFADLIEIDQSNYSRTENGHSSISYPVICNLIYKVNVNPMYLFFGEGEIFRNENNPLSTKEALVRIEDGGNYHLVTVKVPKGAGKN